jgi:hypothetical protein
MRLEKILPFPGFLRHAPHRRPEELLDIYTLYPFFKNNIPILVHAEEQSIRARGADRQYQKLFPGLEESGFLHLFSLAQKQRLL